MSPCTIYLAYAYIVDIDVALAIMSQQYLYIHSKYNVVPTERV